MAKGKWIVMSARVDGGKIFRAYRLRDAERSDTEENREYAGDWCTDRRAVEALARYLNDKEEEDACP